MIGEPVKEVARQRMMLSPTCQSIPSFRRSLMVPFIVSFPIFWMLVPPVFVAVAGLANPRSRMAVLLRTTFFPPKLITPEVEVANIPTCSVPLIV